MISSSLILQWLICLFLYGLDIGIEEVMVDDEITLLLGGKTR